MGRRVQMNTQGGNVSAILPHTDNSTLRVRRLRYTIAACSRHRSSSPALSSALLLRAMTFEHRDFAIDDFIDCNSKRWNDNFVKR